MIETPKEPTKKDSKESELEVEIFQETLEKKTGKLTKDFAFKTKAIRVQKLEKTFNVNGENITSSLKIFLSKDVNIPYPSKIQYGGKVYSILSRYKAFDGVNKVHHIEVTI